MKVAEYIYLRFIFFPPSGSYLGISSQGGSVSNGVINGSGWIQTD